jgi:hypothetical protein
LSSSVKNGFQISGSDILRYDVHSLPGFAALFRQFDSCFGIFFIVFDYILCEVRAYKMKSINAGIVSYRRSA